MVKKGPLSIFKGKQGYMYSVALLAWANYAEYQLDFAKENSMYTKQLGEDQQAAITAARDQPNVKQRRDIPKAARKAMNTAAVNCRAIWQLLSGLIEKSYPPDQWEIQKSLAGSNEYAKSSGDNWPATNDLNKAATDFITDEEAALTAGGMLPGFPARFAAVKQMFDDLFSTYYITKQGSKDATGKKRGANNNVFKATMSMLNDGKKFFHTNADVVAKFNYNALMKTVAGEGFTKTGYHFIITDGATGLPVTDATAVFTNDKNSYDGKMGKVGNLRCLMPAGTYQYTLKAPGFTTAMGTVQAVEGSMRQKTIKLRLDAGGNTGNNTNMSSAEAV